MTIDKDLRLILKHPEWHKEEKGVGYVPTDKAPDYAKEAMKRLNNKMKEHPDVF